MSERTKVLFADAADNQYTEDQVVLEEKDGKKTFHTGTGGSVVTPIGSGMPADDIYDEIKADRDKAKETNKPATAPKL